MLLGFSGDAIIAIYIHLKRSVACLGIRLKASKNLLKTAL